MKKYSTTLSLVLSTLTITFGFSAVSLAQASIELSCRVKAKELAAETYKGCMTEGRQSQIEQIRKDYKEKLSDLKNHYDKELKKLNPNTENISSENSTPKTKYNSKKAELKKVKERVTGNRMPLKKSNTQVIDFSSQTSEPGMVKSDETLDSQAQIDTPVDIQTTSNEEIEVVELPPQR